MFWFHQRKGREDFLKRRGDNSQRQKEWGQQGSILAHHLPLGPLTSHVLSDTRFLPTLFPLDAERGLKQRVDAAPGQKAECPWWESWGADSPPRSWDVTPLQSGRPLTPLSSRPCRWLLGAGVGLANGVTQDTPRPRILPGRRSTGGERGPWGRDLQRGSGGHLGRKLGC